MIDRGISVFLIENNPEDTPLIRNLLSEVEGAVFDVHTCEGFPAGLGCLADGDFDAVLLDLPPSVELALALVEDICSQAANIPIVTLSTTDDAALGMKVLQAGAQDYLSKGQLDPSLLCRSICFAIERKQGEQSLRARLDRLQAFSDSLPDLAFVLDEDGRYVDILTGQKHLLYADMAQLKNRTLLEVLPKDVAASILATVQETIASGEPQMLEYVLDVPAGKIWFEGRTSPVPGTQDGKRTVVLVAHDITLRKQRDAQLRQLSRAVEQSANSIVITDFKGNLEYVNPKFSRLTGYTLEEVLGRNPRFLKSGHTSPEEYKHLWETITRGNEWRGEFHNRKKNGDLYWELATISPITNEQGAITHFLAIKEDITERKQMEVALRNREARLRSIMDSADDAIITVDSQGIIVFWNPAAARIYGYTADEIVGQSFAGITAPHLLETYMSELRRVVETEGLESFALGPEAVGVKKDGSEFPIEFSVSSWRSGKALFFTTIVRDITERTKAEKALRESQRTLTTLMSNLPGMAYRCQNDPDWTMEFVSEGCLPLTGYDRSDLIGNQKVAYGQLIHPADRDQVWESVQAALRENKSFQLIYRIITNTGLEKWVWEKGRGIIASDGEIVAIEGFITDITERIEAENALRESEERLAAILDLAHDAVISVDENARIIIFNRTAERIFGYQAAEAIGQSLDLLIPRQFVGNFQQGFRNWVTEPEIDHHTGQQMEVLGRRKDGSEFPAEVSISRLIQKDQIVFTSILRDISERKQAEDALRESEEQFRTITEASLVGVYIIQDGKFSYVNPTLTMILGYSADELLDGMGSTDLVHPDDRERVAESIRARVAGEMEAAQYRLRVIRKSGEIIDCEVLGRRVDYQGHPAIIGTLMDITERKRAEDALRESEARYRTVIAAIAEGVITHDAEGNVIAANSSAKQILGLTTEQMLEGALADVHWTVIREDGSPFPMADRPVRKTLATGQSQSGIVMGLQRPEGNTTWLMNNSEPLYSENQNELVGVVTTFRDITERKRAEDVLRESEERYRSVIAAIGEGVIIHDTDGNAIATNHSAEQLLRLTAEQIIEDGALRDAYWTVVREDGSPYPLEERPVMKTLATGESQSNVIMGLQRPDGNTIWLMNNSEPLHAQNRDELAGVVASFWDITERKHEQQALQESEELHRSLFENAPIGLAIIRDDGDLMACNDALLHSGGYTREDVAGINIMALFHNLEEAIEIVEIFDREGKIEEFETQLRRKDDTPYAVLLSMRPVQMGGQPSWHVLVDDITERKTNEAMLKDLNQRLRDRAAELTRSNAELESFAYVASHDLQEPLRMVSSYVELLARRYQGQLDDDADEFIAYAVDGANRMRNLINDLLLYSRAGTRGKDLEVVDGEAVLSASLANLRLAIEESGATISHDPLPTILADARQLGQVFQNLISNAIKFRSDKPPEIHISAERTGDNWCFAVRDNGIGLAPEFFERIFVIFQRLHTKEEYPGTGIGLAVSKRIVERHGGQMWLESQPGEGTTFYFTLSGDGDHHLENGGDITD